MGKPQEPRSALLLCAGAITVQLCKSTLLRTYHALQVSEAKEVTVCTVRAIRISSFLQQNQKVTCNALFCPAGVRGEGGDRLYRQDCPSVSLNSQVVLTIGNYNATHCTVLQVSEAKEVTAFAGKYKEAKRCRAYEAYQHLAAAVTFDTQIQPLLQLVQDKLPSATSPSIRAKLEQLLAAAARGVAVNPSVTAEGLAVWLGQELDACLKVEEAARAKAKAAVGAATATGSAAGKRTPKQQSEAAAAAAAADGNEEQDDDDSACAAAAAAAAAGDGSQHLYLLVHFCVTVLNGALKKGVLSGRSAEVLVLLDPLLPLLVRCLYSRHLGSVQVGVGTGIVS
jgi:hypothetical protein